MVDLKPKKTKTKKKTVVRRGMNRQQLFLLMLISILIHALGLFLFVRYRPPEKVGSKDSLEPIDFTVIPEEVEETIDEDEIAETDAIENDLPAESPAPTPAPEAVAPPAPPAPTPPVEQPTPEPVTPPEPEPIPEAVAPTEPTPEPKPVPTPEPLTPPVEQPTPEPAPAPEAVAPTEPEPEPEPEPVAANPPSELIPEPNQPANPDEVSTSASDLLGGDYEKTLASGGDAFFSPEALEYNSVLNPEQLKALKGIDLSEYLAGMESRVKPNWNPAFRQEDRKTVLTFNIQKNGQVTGLTVIQSSGLAEVDRESIEAIEKSAPFAPLPANFPLDSLEITFTFNIRIY